MSKASMYPSLLIGIIVITWIIQASSEETELFLEKTEINFEECLRKLLFPGSPISYNPVVIKHDHRDTELKKKFVKPDVCQEISRTIFIQIRRTGRLPDFYLDALCKVLGNDGKVLEYIKKTFPRYNLQRLIDGRSCLDGTAALNPNSNF
ncbi:hypothetical protein K2173_026439 [Erythroxylum novogranatense]|uniref:Uncharacterized protein n=1 Tax=Erythroxylum novogranatense TaxID=1862640 RepID=A0AAV8TW44_9ROSI|nr:hypothetical protein K2173_026439 [Erythroxylum novogranatense]